MILARAPFRISLGGGGTDLPSYYSEHGGFVLAAAIDKYLYVAVNRPAADDLIRLKYSRYEEVERPEQLKHDLVRAALRSVGLDRKIEIVSVADVPGGTGLGSSSTYLVSLLTALGGLAGPQLRGTTLAERAFHIEAEIAGHPVGKQDHYIAALGGIMCLEIERDGTVYSESLRVSESTLDGMRNRILLFFTGLDRSSDRILQQQRDDLQAGADNVLTSLHETKRIGRDIRDALERNDLDSVGHLMHEHWENKKRRSSAISSRDIDHWYDAAREAGALGGKIVGAGGGGFLMVCCSEGKEANIRSTLSSEGLNEMAYQFDHVGATVLVNA
jgi:D-glycero-alpha-D-manno-heptose-7-phosphate kinase